MSTIVFVEMPAFGHVNPSLPLVRELVRRGERVIYYNDVQFQAMVEASGATFRAYPPGVVTSGSIAQATQTGDLIRVPRLILDATHALVPWLQAELSDVRPDAVVLDSNALWGHIVVRSMRLRSVSLLTTIVLGLGEYRRLRAREWLHMLRPMLPSVVPIITARTRLLRQFGSSVPRPAFPAFGDLNIAMFARLFQSASPRIDASVRFVGPMIDPESRRVDVQFEPTGAEPLVYMSLGTLHRASTAFYRECLEVFADAPVRFVLSTGGDVDLRALEPLPPNSVARPSFPQLEVLQHAAVFITHGGMNSVQEGLARGVPLLVIPQHAEQLAIGLTAAQQGAAMVRREHVAGEALDARALRHCVDHILAMPQFASAAQRLQSVLQGTGGFREATDAVQALIGGTEVRPGM
jgi:MGT family glycosyltransferase